MEYELSCYAGRNTRINLRAMDYKEKYFSFLSILWDYIDCQEKWRGNPERNNPYVDPDQIDPKTKWRINPQFYSDLRDFLNHKDHKEVNKEKEYIYKDTDEYIDDGDSVKLVSDQFGFSAPSSELKHPYDIYLKQCKAEGKNKNVAINNVINWVMESRTIGGSFLWPKDIWGGKDGGHGYNAARGGTNPFDAEGKYKEGSRKGRSYSYYYIEDRVDLTLLEIKHYLDTIKNETLYDTLYEHDILRNYIKENTVGRKWIESFGKSEESKESPGFKGYVDYFCFNPFVDEKQDYMPYDIVESDMANGKKVCIVEEKINCSRNANNTIYGFDADKLAKMFDNVNYMIKERSRMIIEMLNSG